MSHSAFFYGTLLHPSILRRVIGHQGSGLEICPALLLEHTRHKIRNAEYPAVLPYEKSRELFATSGYAEPPADERNVRGTLVTGLEDKDIALLDLFEGDEYTRESVLVRPLGPLTTLSSTPVPRTTIPSVGAPSPPPQSATDAYVVPLNAPELPPLDSLAPPLPAETYVYAGPLGGLSPELWSYDDFIRENAWKWIGRGALDDNYVEVDRRREMNGKILQTEIVDDAGQPETGRVRESLVVEVEGR